MPVESAVPLVLELLDADSLMEKRRVLDRHPILLNEGFDPLFGLVSNFFRERQGDEATSRYVELHHALVRRCREVGLDQAFREATSEGAS
jgi:hypothetical protein